MKREDLSLLDGAIDMHAHTGPALFRRLLDDSELAKVATEYRMRGFVLKDHDALTTGRAYHVNKMHPEIESVGAIVLNRSVGGLSAHVAQAAIQYGAKIVWMPSNHSHHHQTYFSTSDYPGMGRLSPQLEGEGLVVLDEKGNLKQEVLTILDLCADADIAVATGHLSLREIRPLLDAAVERGVQKFIVTHANWALCKLELDVQRELIAKGAYLEYVAVSVVSPIFHEQAPSELASWICELSGERLIFGSDLGQFAGPPQPEGLRMLFAALLGEGVPFDDLEKMSKANPAHLLGLG